MSFESLQLHESIKKAISNLGYTQPTPVQAKSIPVVLEGRDVVACAQTGTGKTAAFVLPALNRLINEPSKSKHPRILVLTPTRELATQITKAAFQYGRQMRFNMASLVGGMSYHTQIRDLQRGADMIVATPGRLIDHLENDRLDLSHIEMLILDEADRMLDMGFIDDVKMIASETPDNRQTLLFSATLDPALDRVIRELMREPERFDLSEKQLTAPKIKQTLYKTKNMHDKLRLLKHLLDDEAIYKSIIFVSTKVSADTIADELNHAGYSVAPLHGGLRQNVRTRTLDALRQNKGGRGKSIQHLVATDVAARGIDISDITHVINFDLPRQSEDYVHRIGRTGRAGREGEAVSFVSGADVEHIRRIERYLGQRLRLVQLQEGQTEVQEISPERPFVKNDDTRMDGNSYGYGKKRENEKRSFRSERSHSDKPSFKKRDGESRSFSRDEKPRRSEFRSMEAKPFQRKEERRSDARPSFRREERSGDARPSFRREERSGDARPSFRREERSAGDARPSFRREERSGDAKPSFRREERSNDTKKSVYREERSGDVKISYRREERSDAKPAFRGRERNNDMNPFAKPKTRSYMNDDRDARPSSARHEKTSAGMQPMKKAGFRGKAGNDAKPFQKREGKKAQGSRD
jgi:superfamily II DNA/RNA helicase